MTTKRRKSAKRQSTALVVRRGAGHGRPLFPARKPSTTKVTLARQVRRLEALSSTPALDDSIQLGDYGLVEVKFTKAEEAVLAEPLVLEDIRVKPTGQVYLPHMVYTRWLNRAFGRTGWALRPVSKPLLNDNSVVVPYLLLVHQKPIAFALGEQEYFAHNRDQSYGDALESTVASGLRRCCKHLGLALELWDRAFGDSFLAEHCVRVKTEGQRDGKTVTKYLWRRKIDSALWNEIETGRRLVQEDDLREVARPVPPVAHHGQADPPISRGQLGRLWTIIRSRGRSEAEVKSYFAGLGYDSSKDIKHKDYDTIVAAIEHPGPLPILERTPGQEG